MGTKEPLPYACEKTPKVARPFQVVVERQVLRTVLVRWNRKREEVYLVDPDCLISPKHVVHRHLADRELVSPDLPRFAIHLSDGLDPRCLPVKTWKIDANGYVHPLDHPVAPIATGD